MTIRNNTQNKTLLPTSRLKELAQILLGAISRLHKKDREKTIDNQLDSKSEASVHAKNTNFKL